MKSSFSALLEKSGNNTWNQVSRDNKGIDSKVSLVSVSLSQGARFAGIIESTSEAILRAEAYKNDSRKDARTREKAERLGQMINEQSLDNEVFLENALEMAQYSKNLAISLPLVDRNGSVILVVDWQTEDGRIVLKPFIMSWKHLPNPAEAEGLARTIASSHIAVCPRDAYIHTLN